MKVSTNHSIHNTWIRRNLAFSRKYMNQNVYKSKSPSDQRACLITKETVSELIFLSLQYFELSQSQRSFAHLLALQEQQQRAIFSLLIIVSSFIICSQVAVFFFSDSENSTQQYTHILSLFRTSFSSQFGIFQLFIM
jgi:hypothetical protein